MVDRRAIPVQGVVALLGLCESQSYADVVRQEKRCDIQQNPAIIFVVGFVFGDDLEGRYC